MPRPTQQITRDLGTYIRIFSEEAVTEIKYFSSLFRDRQLRGAKIEKPTNHAPLGIVNAAIDAKKEAKKLKIADENIYIWAVFDCDGHANIPKAIDKAKANGINVAFSNICFELWVLLHYTYSSAQHTPCDDVIKQVKIHNPNYSKEGTYDIYAALKDKINTACTNAERLLKHNEDSNPNPHFWELNPYTDVHKLVDFLLSA
jgi:hypothetical protein